MSTVALVYLLTLLFIRRREAQQPACEPWQVQCSNGVCIAPNRFCDGNDDCGDSSDEPIACTNCNRTLMGESGVKYPVRITEPPPLQRHLPFSCILNVAAAANQRVEISFLSFNIGTLQASNQKDNSDSSRLVCRNGYLHLSETGASGTQEDRFRSQQTRGFSQLISALKEPDSRRRLSTLFEDASGNPKASDPDFGYFCGRLLPSAAGVTFYSSRSNVTVAVHLPARTSVGPSQLFGLYLTYRFIPPSDTAHVDREIPVHLGKPVPKTYCDRTFVDCDRKQCLIRSPNFPGLFLRNFTCIFTIRQERIPENKMARLEIFQTNEYKIQVGGTSTATPSMSVGQPDRSAGLTSDCDQDDVVEIFDKKNLIGNFCGSGSLMSVMSSGPEMMVVLKSRPEGNLYASKLELQLRVHYYDSSHIQSELHFDESNRCSLTIDGSVTRTGKIRNPQHTIPRGSICEVRFIGARPTDRIWLYFLSYFVRYRSSSVEYIPSSRETSDNCDISSLELYLDHSAANMTNPPSFRFCERTTPVMCTRASDYPNGVPEKPCLPPTESYFSTTSEAAMKYTYFGSPEVSSSGTASLFVVSYEFVDVDREPQYADTFFQEDDGEKEGTRCRNFFNNADNTRYESTFHSPSNVFLFGRGGNTNLECRYEFRVLPEQIFQIDFQNYRTNISDCETRYDPSIRKWICHFTNGVVNRNRRRAFIEISESTPSAPQVLLGCICSSYNKTFSDSEFVFQSARTFKGTPPRVSESTIQVTYIVEGMKTFEDNRHFGFSANYLYVPVDKHIAKVSSGNCQTRTIRSSNNSGEVVFSVAQNRCLWCLTSRAGLKVKFNSVKCDSSVVGAHLLVYENENTMSKTEKSVWRPKSAVCLPKSTKSTTKLEFFGVKWPKKVTNEVTPTKYVTERTTNTSDDGNTNILYQQEVIILEIVSKSAQEVSIEWNLSIVDVSAESESHEASRRLGDVNDDDSIFVTANCVFRCPELNACINPELLCDGIVHCPNTAFDEAPENCNRHSVAFYVGISTGILLFVAILISAIVLLATHRCTLSRNSEGLGFDTSNEPHFTRTHNEDKQSTSKIKQRQLKCYPRQIQAVEVRYPIIHM